MKLAILLCVIWILLIGVINITPVQSAIGKDRATLATSILLMMFGFWLNEARTARERRRTRRIEYERIGVDLINVAIKTGVISAVVNTGVEEALSEVEIEVIAQCCEDASQILDDLESKHADVWPRLKLTTVGLKSTLAGIDAELSSLADRSRLREMIEKVSEQLRSLDKEATAMRSY